MTPVLLVLLLAPALIEALYNGEEATENYKFMAHLKIGEEGKEIQCGGVIYSSKSILTTARCVAPKGQKVKVSEVDIVVGAADWTDEAAEHRATPSVKKIITFPAYKGGYEADIALLVLTEELVFGDGVGKIEVATSGWIASWVEGTQVTVNGWGGTQESDEGVEKLQKIEYELSDQKECGEYWSQRGMPLGDSMFCAGSPTEEKHAWNGDQGGPVFYIDSTPKLLGLVSWGKDRSPRDYDVMTDVSGYTDLLVSALSDAEQYPWVELHGGLNHGVVLIHREADKDGPTTICTDEVTQVEIDAICKTLGFNTGSIQSAREYAGKYPTRGYSSMPKFGVTRLDCKNSANVFKDCTYASYPAEAKAPCFDGQQLAVQCSNEAWNFEFTHMQTKTGARGRAMCRLAAHHYGAQIDVKSEIVGTLVNIFSDKVEKVEENMKWRKKQDTFLARYQDLEHSCLACVAAVRGTEGMFKTFILEDESVCKMERPDAQTKLEEWLKTFDPDSVY